MQGNGFKVGATVFFVLLCGYYLFPSLQNMYVSYRAGQMEPEARQEYMSSADVQQIKENSLKLGLDLQGGMHVTLEVQVADLLNQLATNKDETFREVLQAAVDRATLRRASRATSAARTPTSRGAPATTRCKSTCRPRPTRPSIARWRSCATAWTATA
jgi:preprotein translocase subunit SecD